MENFVLLLAASRVFWAQECLPDACATFRRRAVVERVDVLMHVFVARVGKGSLPVKLLC